MGKSIQAAARAVADVATFASDKDAALKLQASLLDTLDPPDNGITPELLSPVPSRNPSPRRIRPKSKSPARWKILRSINAAIQDVLDIGAPGVYGTLVSFPCSLLSCLLSIQYPSPKILVQAVMFNTLTLTTSALLVCVVPSKRALTAASLPAIA